MATTTRSRTKPSTNGGNPALRQKREADQVRERLDQRLCIICGMLAAVDGSVRCEACEPYGGDRPLRTKESRGSRGPIAVEGDIHDLDEPAPSVQGPAERHQSRYVSRYHRLKAQGLCIKCGQKPPRVGKITKKYQSDKALYAEALRKGLCARCRWRPPRAGMTSCEPCSGRHPRSAKRPGRGRETPTKRPVRNPSPYDDDDDDDEDDSEDQDEPMPDLHDDSDKEAIEEEIVVMGYETEDEEEEEEETDEEKDNEPLPHDDIDIQDPDESLPHEYDSDGEDPVGSIATAQENDEEQEDPVFVDHERDNRMGIDFLLC
ncbi:hypothetical protein PG988_012838 [Apiospora saccharicola]